MVDKDQIEDAYQADARESIQNALETLAKLRFWEFLVKCNQHRLVEGFETTDEIELARQIREARQENRVFLTLESLYPPQE